MYDRQPNLNDYARPKSGETSGKMTVFYKISPSVWLGQPGENILIPCLPQDQDMSVIELNDNRKKRYRPWDLEWLGTDPRSDQEKRNDYTKSVVGNEQYALWHHKVLGRFPPLSSHEKLKLFAWRRDTSFLIQEHENTPGLRMRRIRAA